MNNEAKITLTFSALMAAIVALDYWRPIDAMVVSDDHIVKSLRQWTHTLGTLCLGVLAITLVDRIFLPWLRIHDVIYGNGSWADVSVWIRSATVLGWFLMAAAILLSITQGTVAL